MLTVKGRINENGELEAALPAGVEPGDVTVTIEYRSIEREDDDSVIWTDEELAKLIQPRDTSAPPLTSVEIAERLDAMRPTGWEDVADGATWVKQQRERRGRSLGW